MESTKSTFAPETFQGLTVVGGLKLGGLIGRWVIMTLNAAGTGYNTCRIELIDGEWMIVFGSEKFDLSWTRACTDLVDRAVPQFTRPQR